MKLKKIDLENVSSFRDKEEIHFNNGLNIFIGPNGGGKTNLLEIIARILNSHFVSPWNLSENDQKLQATTSKENVNNVLKINDENSSPNKVAVFTFVITKEDIFNIEVIKNNLELLTTYQNKLFGIDSIKGQFGFIFKDLYDLKKYENKEIVYRTLPRLFRRASDLVFPTSHEDELFHALFETYLSFYELISHLLERINSDRKDNKLILFKSIFHCVSSNRNVGTPSFTITPNVAGYMGQKNNLKINGVRGESNLLDYSINYLCVKYILSEPRDFDTDEIVVSIRKNLRYLNYEFSFEKTNALTNKCKFILRRGEKEIEFEKCSPGEKSVISLLFFFFCMELNNGILVIDEPELHLHPKWQKLLSNIINEVLKKGKNQILFATHSPVFVSGENLNSIQRVFKSDGTTKVKKERKKIIEVKIERSFKF